MSTKAEYVEPPRQCTYLMNIVPVRNRQTVGELPIFVHELELVSRHKQTQDQFHLQFCHTYTRTRMTTSSPANERIWRARNWIRSQPPTWVVLVWIGVLFRVQVNIGKGIRDEISSSDDLPTNRAVLARVPSQGNTAKGYSLGLPDASVENRELVFPR